MKKKTFAQQVIENFIVKKMKPAYNQGWYNDSHCDYQDHKDYNDYIKSATVLQNGCPETKRTKSNC